MRSMYSRYCIRSDFPSPWLSWAAVSLPAEPEPILAAFLLAEELEHACHRQPLGQRGGLLLRARLPQAGLQPGHPARVVQGGVGGGPVQGADVSADVVRRVGEVNSSAEVAAGGGVLVQLGGVTV